ncbi:MAG TPA: glutamate 5-kinase [Solirubrobacteraceae bacterium]|nr:glutamate 5-kinase [Solirubrobacteraceae bacterium]
MSATVVKLGTSIVAEDDGAPRVDVLGRICDEVSKLPRGVIVTSGAIARGMRVMGLAARPAAIADLQAASAVGQGKLFPLYDELLRDRGRVAAQVLLTFHDMRERTHYLNARQTLRRLLDWGVVPVINENDTTATDEISFGDNDFLAAQVAVLLGARRLVLLTNTDGLYTANPVHDPEARLITEVTDYAALEAMSITQETSLLGSGGMRSKVGAAEMASAAGIPTTICNGLRPGALARAIAGDEEGTRFVPLRERTSSFKLWLKYAKPAHGTIVVDAGAARALREGGTSLLPVGIVEVHGTFDAGDAVEIVADGGTIGKGIVNFADDELRRICGLKSAEVREIFPAAGEEAVHRDYFVLS